jgi:hypothetical protein
MKMCNNIQTIKNISILVPMKYILYILNVIYKKYTIYINIQTIKNIQSI